jgi:hypothetical protein
MAGKLRLVLAHHVHHLNPTEDHTGSGHRLEAQYWPYSPLDGVVILFDAIIQVGTLPDPDWVQLAPRPVLKLICGVTQQDRFSVGLAAVDHDPPGSAMPLKCFTKKPFGRSEVSPNTELEFDSVAIAVDGSIEKFPLASDFDVSFVDLPLGSNGSLA